MQRMTGTPLRLVCLICAGEKKVLNPLKPTYQITKQSIKLQLYIHNRYTLCLCIYIYTHVHNMYT